MAARVFVIDRISKGEFGMLVKFQIKSSGTTTDEVGSKEWKKSETYYRWYSNLNPGIVEKMSITINPENYDKVESDYTFTEGEDKGKTIPLTYLKDKK